ncbi:MAG: diguanylate cyclase [Candidatus Omnitrophica bacterium]|nr:diguanylate cyclase [Candidatus Omnitrophota bacterium]
MSIKVLVVDDQEDNIELLSQMLEENGIEAITTQSGRDAITLARAEMPDVILLDIQMPDIDGYEICRRLKEEEKTRSIPVIFLTAIYSSEKNIVKGLELGAYDYITKPFREGELLARINVMAKIKQTEDNVREESYTDALTGLYNRRFLEKRFAEEISRSLRTNLPLACLMLDIDHFKSHNDLYGHECGDAVLKKVADTMRHALRAYDTVARYGGEEFVIILPSTEYHDAECVAEKIRRTVEKMALQANGQTVFITVSVGVFCAKGEELRQGIDEFIRKADEALYKAKGMGRNKIVSYRDIYPE